MAGPLLRCRREARGLSQGELAALAGVSAKLVSHVEAGRLHPDPDLIMHLCAHLDVPLRHRNEILVAAGFPAAYPERPVDGPRATPTRRLLETIAEAQRYPALVLDEHWNLVTANTSARSLTERVSARELAPPLNFLALLVDPAGLAPCIVNLEDYTASILHRLRHVYAARPNDGFGELVEALSTVAAGRHAYASDLAVPLVLRLDGTDVELVSTVATFGSPREITLSELVITSLYPASPADRVAFDAYLGRRREPAADRIAPVLDLTG